ncbi:hypothetical protein ES707_06712 [subsurface metagenome]
MSLDGRSICPFCLKKFKHIESYHPPSCGAFKCQKELASENFSKVAQKRASLPRIPGFP